MKVAEVLDSPEKLMINIVTDCWRCWCGVTVSNKKEVCDYCGLRVDATVGDWLRDNPQIKVMYENRS